MKQQPERRRRVLLRAIASAGIARGASLVIRALIGLVFARLLGAAEVGELFLALAVGGLIALFARRGLDRLALSDVANHPAEARAIAWHRLMQVGRQSIALSVLIGALSLVAGNVFESVNVAFLWALAAVTPLNTSQVVSHVLRGEQRVISSILIGATVGPVLRLAVFFALPGAATAERAAAAFAIGWAITAVIGLVVVRPRRAALSGAWTDGVVDARSLHTLALNEQFRETYASALMWLVGIPAEVGALGAAQRLDQAAFLPTSATRFATAPLFASADRNLDQARLLAIRTARKSIKIQIPVTVVGWVLAPRLLSILGDGFATGTTWLRLLLVAALVNSATGSTTQFLLMSPHRGTLARSSNFGTMVLLVSSAALVPFVGPIGVAVALALASSARQIVEWQMIGSLLGGRVDIAATPHPEASGHS